MSDTKPAPSHTPNASEMTEAEIEAEEQKIRMLKRVVIGLGILIVIGVFALIGGLIYKSTGAGSDIEPIAQTEPQIPAPVSKGSQLLEQIDLELPKGAVIEDVNLDGSNLAVRWWQADANQNHIWIVDLRDGSVAQKIRVTNPE